MKFVIYREVDGKRKTLVEWDKDRIVEELHKELKYPNLDLESALDTIIEKFKKKTITIP